MKKTAPAFMLYASDLMANREYRTMPLAERGLLVSMYCECWVNGSVPASPEVLAKWLGFESKEVAGALTARVLTFFEQRGGDLIAPELERYREVLLGRRKNMSTGGKKGAEKRWHSTDSHPNGHPNGGLMGSRVEMNRVEKKRGESLEKGNSQNHEWLNDYERASNGG